MGSNPIRASKTVTDMKKIYIFDVDDTLIDTKACIRAIDENGNEVFRAGTKVFNAPDSTERLLRPGLSWDFSEFESLEQIKSERTLEPFNVLMAVADKYPCYIITARQRNDMLHTWLNDAGIKIDIDNIFCFNRDYKGTVAHWKEETLLNIIMQEGAGEVHIYEDDVNNLRAMEEAVIMLNATPILNTCF